ncbi:MAG TPA: argininosuccinate lyase [Candidatus Limnocylindria bacterium]|nr:argininosuccinate lyase [Candidatus Limnocylindria bacterium]
MKTWGGRFAEPPDSLAADFGRSDDHDRELLPDDLAGSIAHVRGLGRAGVLSEDEVRRLVGGLEALVADVEGGRFAWDDSLEDVHAQVEAALEAKVGPLAGKLHTGRSRNDQVATDLRLWLRRTLDELDGLVLDLERALVGLALAHREAVMPGHTHAQPAQPVLFAHHLLAHVEMLERDRGRLADARRRANVSPLGSGALAGAGFRLEREPVAAELGFAGVSANSIDASGDRDFAAEALFGFSLAMVHLSRLAEEVAWWSSPRFGFVRPSDAYSTGSSMMPNKRNPDPAELVRGRAGLVVGRLAGVLALLKGLPLGYQRDLQEVKAPLMDSARVLGASLAVMAGLVASLVVDEERMASAAGEGFTTATAVADALAEEGVAFRAAHHVVGSLVRRAEAARTDLTGLPDDAFTQALAASDDQRAKALARDPHVAARLRSSAGVRPALERCDVTGGTAPGRVAAALADAAARLDLA